MGEYVRTERNFPPRSVVRFAEAPEYELSDGDFFDLVRTEGVTERFGSVEERTSRSITTMSTRARSRASSSDVPGYFP